MAINPVAAFLQGFAVVDQLETNRERRAFLADERSFRREERSQLRNEWEFRNEQINEARLTERRRKNLVDFNAMTQQLVMEKGAEIEALKEAGRNTEAEQLSAQWFGNSSTMNGRGAGFLLAANETVKRLVAKNPELGEHIALALGHDPAAGPLIEDTTRPVSGVALVPPEADPAGTGGIAIEVRSTNGPQPLTENRTANPNDRVAIRPVGLEELVEVFGEGVLKNDFLIAQQLRSFANVEATGQPLASQERADSRRVQQQGTTIEGESTELPPEESIDARSTSLGIEESRRIARERGVLADPEVTGGGTKIDQQQQTDADLRSTMFDSNAPVSSRIASGVRLLAGDITKLTDSILDRGEAIFQGEKPINAVGGFIVDVVQETLTGKTPETQGQGFDEKMEKLILGENKNIASPDYSGKQALAAAPTSINDISSAGAKPSDYTPSKVSQPGLPASKAVLRAPIPSSVETAQQMATSVVNTQGKPSFVDVFNATSLTKAGVITPTQLFRYARTGQFDEPTKKQLLSLGSGAFAIFDPDTGGVAFGQVPGTGAEAESDIDIFKDQRTLIENSPEFQDSDGNVDEARVQVALEQIETATDTLQSAGLIDRKSRTNRSLLSSLKQGQRFVRRFSADPSQTFDFNPFSDPELGPNNMALGFIADQFGITNQEDADRFLFDYGITLRGAFPNMRAEDVITNVINMELKVQRAKNRNDQRTEVVEATIERAKKNGQ